VQARAAQNSAVSCNLKSTEKSLQRKEKTEAEGFFCLPARPCAGLLFGRQKSARNKPNRKWIEVLRTFKSSAVL